MERELKDLAIIDNIGMSCEYCAEEKKRKGNKLIPKHVIRESMIKSLESPDNGYDSPADSMANNLSDGSLIKRKEPKSNRNTFQLNDDYILTPLPHTYNEYDHIDKHVPLQRDLSPPRLRRTRNDSGLTSKSSQDRRSRIDSGFTNKSSQGRRSPRLTERRSRNDSGFTSKSSENRHNHLVHNHIHNDREHNESIIGSKHINANYNTTNSKQDEDGHKHHLHDHMHNHRHSHEQRPSHENLRRSNLENDREMSRTKDYINSQRSSNLENERVQKQTNTFLNNQRKPHKFEMSFPLQSYLNSYEKIEPIKYDEALLSEPKESKPRRKFISYDSQEDMKNSLDLTEEETKLVAQLSQKDEEDKKRRDLYNELKAQLTNQSQDNPDEQDGYPASPDEQKPITQEEMYASPKNSNLPILEETKEEETKEEEVPKQDNDIEVQSLVDQCENLMDAPGVTDSRETNLKTSITSYKQATILLGYFSQLKDFGDELKRLNEKLTNHRKKILSTYIDILSQNNIKSLSIPSKQTKYYQNGIHQYYKVKNYILYHYKRKLYHELEKQFKDTTKLKSLIETIIHLDKYYDIYYELITDLQKKSPLFEDIMRKHFSEHIYF